jgi:hypothetical protein
VAITYSIISRPINPQVVDSATGRMREEWQLYFDQLTTRLNAAVSELSSALAPADAQYVVGSASSGLSAERLVTDSISVTWNLSVAGQAAVERAALTGDVTAPSNSNTTTIAANAVTYEKMQDVTETSRILGRRTAGSGDPEECTLSQVLDFIGSAAQGDILYRNASVWARLAAGTNGQFLQTQGAAANPQWATAGGLTLGTEQNTTSGDTVDFTVSNATLIHVVFNGVSISGNDDLLVQLGDAGGIETTGYSSRGSAGGSGATSTSGFLIRMQAAARTFTGIMTLARVGTGHTWISTHVGFRSDGAEPIGGGSKTLSAELTTVRITNSNTGSNDLDAGTANVIVAG